MKISEIITDKYKLRIPPTVYYDLLADVVEAEEEQDPCGDCISRQAVIDVLQPYIDENKDSDDLYLSGCGDGAYHALRMVKDLSPVQPIRPKGKWIDREEYDVDRWKCSKCGNTEQYHEDFCPNCGADMRG